MIEFADRVKYVSLPGKCLPKKTNWKIKYTFMKSYIPETNKEINELVEAFSGAMVNAATIYIPKNKSINNCKRVP